MENGSKALLIAGAILVGILIIAIGLFVVNNTNMTITDSMTSMSTQEIEAYNSKYSIYEGEQSGANIKSLLGILITDSNINKNEITKIPGVHIENLNKGTINSGIPEIGENSSYIRKLESIRTNIQTKHKYWVEMSYQSNGLIDYINISYDKSKLLEPIQRD